MSLVSRRARPLKLECRSLLLVLRSVMTLQRLSRLVTVPRPWAPEVRGSMAR